VSLSSPEINPSTAIVDPNAHWKSPTTLPTMRAAFVGSSRRLTGTALGVVTSSSLLVLHAVMKPAAIATATSEAAILPPTRGQIRCLASVVCLID